MDKSLQDVQNLPDERKIAIQQVGIRGIRHPVRIADKGGQAQATIALFNMYVSLPENVKGTHMSRFVELLNTHEGIVTAENFPEMLPAMALKLGSRSALLEMRFPYFVKKAAPVSGVESLMDYEATFIGNLVEESPSMELKVVVPVTSLCPCSKNISDYGAHNQRSHVTLSVKPAKDKGTIWLDELIQMAEEIASCELYGLLKRPDEKYVTERAYDNPKFVEDMVRDLAHALDLDDRVAAYEVESENFESIHNHSAYARIVRNKLNGEP